MKKTVWIAGLLLALIVSACGSTAPTSIPTVVLDNNSAPSNQGSAAGETTASAVIVPVHEVRLSFAAVGRVTEVNVKVGDQVKTGDVLVKLDTAILEAKVKEAEANLEAAQAQVRFLKRQKTDQVHLDEAIAEVNRAQALLDSANAVLAAQSVLIAPFDGRIAELDVSPAEVITPGRVVVVLGDFSKFQIETTDLSERDVTKIKNGQAATISIEALGAEFSGKVVDVSLTSSTLGGDVVFKVTLDFDQQPDDLRWGMSADVSFQAGE